MQKAGASETLVAAAYLHDTIEDCGLTEPELAAMTTPEVAALVNWVSEPGRNHSDWHDRNAAYRRRMESAPPEALTLSCADKTANMLDMLRLLDKGHQASDFLSVGIEHQVRKFRALGILFQPRVPRPLLACFHSALRRLAAHAG